MHDQSNSSADIVPFLFNGAEVRTISRDGEPWFVLADVCRVLEVGNPSMAASRLDDDEKHTLSNVEGIAAAQVQTFTIINESGLYSLTLTSRKPQAKAFKKWITSEVIPAIRKTGGYMVVVENESPEELALRAMKVLQATVERQKAMLAEAMPKAAAFERIAGTDGSHCITDAAKILQMKPKDLFTFLATHGWIYRRTGADHWCAYQARISSGLVVHKVTTVLRQDGTEKTTEQVRVTDAGIAKLAKILGVQPVYPEADPA